MSCLGEYYRYRIVLKGSNHPAEMKVFTDKPHMQEKCSVRYPPCTSSAPLLPQYGIYVAAMSNGGINTDACGSNIMYVQCELTDVHKTSC